MSPLTGHPVSGAEARNRASGAARVNMFLWGQKHLLVSLTPEQRRLSLPGFSTIHGPVNVRELCPCILGNLVTG